MTEKLCKNCGNIVVKKGNAANSAKHCSGDCRILNYIHGKTYKTKMLKKQIEKAREKLQRLEVELKELEASISNKAIEG